jgi:hypothetical protein
MKRTSLRRRTQLRTRTTLRRRTPIRKAPSLAATDSQRAAVAGWTCIACGSDRQIDPVHLIPRSLGGCGDPMCVVPLCRSCHRAYDTGRLDLLPYLEPSWRTQLAHAVGHVGLIGALRRLTMIRGGDPVIAMDKSGHGVSFALVSETRPAKTVARPDRERELWVRNERIRVAELRADAERPMGELLEEGIALSRFASELAAAARREA